MAQEKSAQLTELEGAILSEIRDRGKQTAFQVRQAFQISPSNEWRGGEGSVYPAIRRMTKRGLIDATASDDKRSTKHLRLTNEGNEALEIWAANTARSISVGIDPFRLRSGIWMAMNHNDRTALFKELRSEIHEAISITKVAIKKMDEIEAVRARLSLELFEARLHWLERAEDGHAL